MSWYFRHVIEAYSLIWCERRLHIKAIWPPIIFLVTAEVCYRKIFHGGDSLAKIWDTLNNVPWYWLAGLALCWLAGLKFLLSFSISWRRHLLLGETFDPFYFKKPFWRYLWFLFETYCWAGLIFSPAFMLLLAPIFQSHDSSFSFLVSVLMTVWLIASLCCPFFCVWFLVRQVLYFNALAVDGRASWRESFRLMKGRVEAYLIIWILAMAPIVAFTFALSHFWKLIGADVSTIPVALADSALRQAALFIHFSLGASIGAIFYRTLVASPETSYSETSNPTQETE